MAASAKNERFLSQAKIGFGAPPSIRLPHSQLRLVASLGSEAIFLFVFAAHNQAFFALVSSSSPLAVAARRENDCRRRARSLARTQTNKTKTCRVETENSIVKRTRATTLGVTRRAALFSLASLRVTLVKRRLRTATKSRQQTRTAAAVATTTTTSMATAILVCLRLRDKSACTVVTRPSARSLARCRRRFLAAQSTATVAIICHRRARAHTNRLRVFP